MDELQLVLKTVSEILKSLSKGSTKLADKLNKISSTLPQEKTTKTRGAKPKQKTAKTPKPKQAKITAADEILNLIQAAPDGADMTYLMDKSGFGLKKVQNIIFKLKKLKKIKTKSRGVYIAS